MRRRLETVGFALVAAIATTAVLASAATAQFTSNKEHTILSGSQKAGTNDVFTAGEGFGGITCETAVFSSTGVTKNDADQSIFPVYETCRDTFGRTIDVDSKINPLKYTFTSSGGGIGTVHVSGEMTWTVTSGGSVVCTIVIKNGQTNTGITYKNLGGTNGIEITKHTANTVTTTTGGFFNCGVANGEHKAGTYDGTNVITGKDTVGNAAEISVD